MISKSAVALIAVGGSFSLFMFGITMAFRLCHAYMVWKHPLPAQGDIEMLPQAPKNLPDESDSLNPNSQCEISPPRRPMAVRGQSRGQFRDATVWNVRPAGWDSPYPFWPPIERAHRLEPRGAYIVPELAVGAAPPQSPAPPAPTPVAPGTPEIPGALGLVLPTPHERAQRWIRRTQSERVEDDEDEDEDEDEETGQHWFDAMVDARLKQIKASARKEHVYAAMRKAKQALDDAWIGLGLRRR